MKGRNINPSNFVCLKCNTVNKYGINRGSNMREFLHIKDLFCSNCKERTKQVEIRYCDSQNEIMNYVPELREIYYSNKNNNCNNRNKNDNKKIIIKAAQKNNLKVS